MAQTTSIHLRKIRRQASNGRARYEWHLRWHGVNGKHYCLKIGNCDKMPKREAQAKRRELQVQMDRREIPRDKPAAITIEEFAEYHKSMVQSDRKPSTLYEYQLSARLAAEALGKETKIQDITAADVGKVKNRLSGSAATRAKHLSRLRAMFNHAKRWGLIHGDNPFADQPMPRFTPRRMRIFTPDEVNAMVDAARTTWWKAFILVGATTGPRKEEILNLLWRDVDMVGKTISITAKKTEKFTGPHGVEYETLAWTPKTYASRSVPAPDETLKILQELRDVSCSSQYVFLPLERLQLINAKMQAGVWRDRAETCNNVLRNYRTIQRWAAKAMEADDWQIGTIHDLRRTYGCRMAEVLPMHVLQRYMGHRDISTTAEFYLATQDHHAAKARAAFDQPNPNSI